MDFIRLLIATTFFTVSAILPFYVVSYVHLFIAARKYRKPVAHRPSEWPTVSVHLPIYNEKHVVKRLIEAVCSLDYPREKLEIVVVDDSDDETSRMCEEVVGEKRLLGFNIRYLRRLGREGYKAGALQYALEKSTGEFVAVFDADFIPPPDFLKKTIPYFKEANIGLVQARWGHLNRTYSPLTMAQALSLDLHFTVEQRGRFAAGYFLNFNGTAGVWRRECIVDAGGWRPSLAEDLDLSYRAQMSGWRIVYLEDVEAPAELPIMMKAVRRQQYRWAYGAIQTARRYLLQLVVSKNHFTAKLHALVHLTRHMAQLLFTAQVLMLPWVAHIVQPTGLELMVFWITLYPLLITVTLLLQSNAAHHRSVTAFLKEVFMLFLWGMGTSVNNSVAVIHALLSREKVFERTPKFGIVGRTGSWRTSSYARIKDHYVMVDLAVAAYTLSTTIYLFYSGMYSFMLVSGLFTAAVLYNVFVSVTQGEGAVRNFYMGSKTLLAAIAMLAVFTISLIYPFTTYFFTVEKAYSSLDIASRSIEPGLVVEELDKATTLLDLGGNPVWPFPTARTDLGLIRRDLQMLKQRVREAGPQDLETYHAVLEDVRTSLREVGRQLRALQPFLWVSPTTLAISLSSILAAYYFLVRRSHA
jgi:cellulose synthase/poly-beta-1,6-N-acetylglucosamine synthase-like glycosyltransferase